ncbi:MAG TPA: hypothetical protein EYP67_05215 [Methanosarcinales archaeon]|nr:hypothetical protein [Methanosarcinales archaeon]
MTQTKKIPCEIISVREGKTWNNVIVKQRSTGKQLFFGKVKKDMDIAVGAAAYMEVEAMASEFPETPLRVTLYDESGTKIDWVIIQPTMFDVR